MDTRERNSRFPIDDHLRNFGYRIESRPNRGEPRWMNVAGVTLGQGDALAHIKAWVRRCRRKKP